MSQDKAPEGSAVSFRIDLGEWFKLTMRPGELWSFRYAGSDLDGAFDELKTFEFREGDSFVSYTADIATHDGDRKSLTVFHCEITELESIPCGGDLRLPNWKLFTERDLSDLD